MTSGTDKGMVFAMVGFPVTYALTDFNCYILIFVKVSVVIIANDSVELEVMTPYTHTLTKP